MKFEILRTQPDPYEWVRKAPMYAVRTPQEFHQEFFKQLRQTESMIARHFSVPGSLLNPVTGI